MKTIEKFKNVELKIDVTQQDTGEYNIFFILATWKSEGQFSRDSKGNLLIDSKKAFTIDEVQLAQLKTMFTNLKLEDLKNWRLDAIKDYKERNK